MDQREERPSPIGRVTAHLASPILRPVAATPATEGDEPRPTPGPAAFRTSSALGDGFTSSFELALTPAVLALAGLGLDRWLGTVPVFTITLAVLGLVGMVARLYYGYSNEMDAHAADRTRASAQAASCRNGARGVSEIRQDRVGSSA